MNNCHYRKETYRYQNYKKSGRQEKDLFAQQL